MSKGKKPRSRWNAGNERYAPADAKGIASKYREGTGWHQGARVKWSKQP